MIDIFAGGQATEDNARGRALRDVGFKGSFNAGQGQGGAGFLQAGDDTRRNQFKSLFDQFTNESLSSAPSSATGVVPIGVVEPLNPLTKEGIANIQSGPQRLGFQRGGADAFQGALQQSQGLDTRLSGAFQGVSEGTAPISGQEFNTRVERFTNPFQQQVIDRALANISRQEDIQQSQLARSAQAGNAFGGTAQGVSSGILSGEAVRAAGDLTASLNAANLDQGFNRALTDLQGERNRDLQGAQIGGQLVNTGSGINTTLQNLARTGFAGQTNNLQNFLNKQNANIAAGDIVRTQNQGLLDVVNQERATQRAEPERQLQLLLDVVRAFSGGGGSTPAQAGSLNNILGGAGLGFGVGDAIGGLDFFGGNSATDAIQRSGANNLVG